MLTQFREMVRYAGPTPVSAPSSDRDPVKLVTILGVVLLLFIAGATFKVAAQSHTAPARLPDAAAQLEPVATSEPEEHGLSQKAVEIGHVFGFPITNSMVVSWIVALGLIIFARIATRRMDQVPSGAQNFLEWLIESLYGFLEGLLGKHLVERTFWYFATVFIFILSANWLGLLPGVGTIGWGEQTAHGFKIDQPLLRGANADVNLTMAMALIFFACWIVWALREVGPGGFLKELFAPKGESSDSVAIATDMAIAAETIDEAKAEEARQRAEARLREKLSDEEVASVNASLARSLAQLRVKRRRHA